MTELEKFKLINGCETTKDLAEAVLAISEDGVIRGRIRPFSAKRMSSFVELVTSGEGQPELLTREFGIRQQALMLKYYSL